MLFWTIAALLALVVVALLAAPLLRPGDEDGAGSASDVALYRAQMDEIDRDLERGTIGPAEAERARAEIGRRLLAADRAETVRDDAAPRGATMALTALVALMIVGGGLGLYAVLGAPGAGDMPRAARLAAADAMREARVTQEEAERIASEQPQPPAPEIPEEYAALVEQLREIVPARPEDAEGWRLLAMHEGRLGNFAAAARAQEHLVSLLGDEATPGERTDLADYLVAAAGGYVSPRAEEIVRGVLARDEGNEAARYTLGLLYARTDRPDIAYSLWKPVAETGDPAAIHTRLARDQIENAAAAAGIDYALPALPGPSAADMAAAQDMDPQARDEMIRGMVAQLSDRLARQGGPAGEWARLITSLAVLDETDRATAILTEARQVFAASEADMAVIESAAGEAGLE